MALAKSTHHCAQRQKTARAGREARVALHGHVPEAPLPQGGRPAPLSDWQSRVLWYTVDQIVDAVPVPTLDGPVPLMAEQLVDVLQLFDVLSPVAEQLIDVPKIFIERIPPRTSVREPQLAEQLVEVPTIVSFSSLQRIMEQTVDIPVPQGGGRHADLQGILRGQSSTAPTVVQIVDTPGGGVQGSRADQPWCRWFSHFSPS